jgi:hypothetical protein
VDAQSRHATEFAVVAAAGSLLAWAMWARSGPGVGAGCTYPDVPTIAGSGGICPGGYVPDPNSPGCCMPACRCSPACPDGLCGTGEVCCNGACIDPETTNCCPGYTCPGGPQGSSCCGGVCCPEGFCCDPGDNCVSCG